MKSPVHPGQIVRNACLEALGLSVTAGAKVLGVSRQALSNLVTGKAGVSPGMAIRLSKAFGSAPETWLKMQLAYDLAAAMKHERRIRGRRRVQHLQLLEPGFAEAWGYAAAAFFLPSSARVPDRSDIFLPSLQLVLPPHRSTPIHRSCRVRRGAFRQRRYNGQQRRPGTRGRGGTKHEGVPACDVAASYRPGASRRWSGGSRSTRETPGTTIGRGSRRTDLKGVYNIAVV